MRRHKILTILGVVVVLFTGACTFFYFQYKPATQFTWGLDYSPEYAQSLGLDPNKLYVDMLADLKPKAIRLAADWDVIEPKPGQYDFGLLDGYLKLAAEDDVQVTLV